MTLVEPLLSKLFSFSMALFANEKLSYQTVIDAYTVYVMKEKRFLLKQLNQELSKKEKSSLRNFLKKELFKEIYDLSLKRLSHSNSNFGKECSAEYASFYSLSTFKRAVIYLKLHEKLTLEQIQEVFGVQRFEVIENFYNGREEISKHGHSKLSEVSFQ